MKYANPDQRLDDGHGGPRRPGRFSQCEKILRVLQDGAWHTTAEIHERAGFSRLNSRISELRKRGYLIECESNGKGGPGGFAYRLVSPGQGGNPTAPALAPPSGAAGAVVSPSVPPSRTQVAPSDRVSAPVQLSMVYA